MRTSYKTLVDAEYNVLNKIASKTKMECWFCLKQDKHGTDYVWDLEERKRRCLKTGIMQLLEGIDCQESYNNCCLTDTEYMIFRELLKKLKIEWSLRCYV